MAVYPLQQLTWYLLSAASWFPSSLTDVGESGWRGDDKIITDWLEATLMASLRSRQEGVPDVQANKMEKKWTIQG